MKPERHFVQPLNKGSGKLKNLNEQLERREDIAATHELFKYLDDISRDMLLAGKYTLILDEVLNVIEQYDIRKDDLQILKDSGCISIDPADGMVTWNEDKKNYEDTQFEEVRRLALNHNLICIHDKMLVWRFPPDIFRYFEAVYILTYLFEGSVMKYYLEFYEIPFVKKSIYDEDDILTLGPYRQAQTAKYRELIHIYEGKLNENFSQEKDSCLSSSWMRDAAKKSSKRHKDLMQIKNNVGNFFRHICKGGRDSILWTTFKSVQNPLSGKGYTKAFLACNCRATNEYAHTSNLAYVLNWYVHPAIIGFLSRKNVKVDQDKIALAELLQWIWRSQIRRGQPINIYIPSKRMRRLLTEWLYGT